MGSLGCSSPHQGTFWGPYAPPPPIRTHFRVPSSHEDSFWGSQCFFSPYQGTFWSPPGHVLGSQCSSSPHQGTFWGPLLTLGSIFGVPRMLSPTPGHVLGSPPHIRIHLWGPSGALPHTRAHFGVPSPLLPHSRAHFGVSMLLLSPSGCILGSPPHIRIHFWGP